MKKLDPLQEAQMKKKFLNWIETIKILDIAKRKKIMLLLD